MSDPSILAQVSIPLSLYQRVQQDCRERGCSVSAWFTGVAQAQFEDEQPQLKEVVNG